MAKSVLIVGEDPALIDFNAPSAPKDMSAERILAGLDASKKELEAAGHTVVVLLTRGADEVERQARDALAQARYDVIVVGAGLRVLPPLTEEFERLINVIHEQAQGSRIAFNTSPGNSAAAAQRHL